MQILPHNFVPARKKASEVVNPPSPKIPCRVRLTRNCVVWSGPVLGQKDDVLEFDLATPEGHEAVACLCSHSTSGVKVAPSTPLHTAPAPAPLPVVAPVAERKDSPGVMEMARALVTALREASLPKTSKA